MTILVVEDENPIREAVCEYLKKSDYTVIEAVDGESAIERFFSEPVDLVVLDLNLPKLDGIEVCKEIREHSNVPIIMATARVDEIDEIIGLEIGADDYVKKPFSPKVLLARIENLLRRSGQKTLEAGLLTINPVEQTVERNGVSLDLTTTQFKILHCLATQPNRVFTRDEIINYAYGNYIEKDIYDRTIDAHIKSIRKVIEEDPKNPEYIVTVIGTGYKFQTRS